MVKRIFTQKFQPFILNNRRETLVPPIPFLRTDGRRTDELMDMLSYSVSSIRHFISFIDSKVQGKKQCNSSNNVRLH